MLGYIFFILEACVYLDKGLCVEVCDFLLIAQKRGFQEQEDKSMLVELVGLELCEAAYALMLSKKGLCIFVSVLLYEAFESHWLFLCVFRVVMAFVRSIHQWWISGNAFQSSRIIR